MHPKNNKSRIGEKITISHVQERVEAYLPPWLPPNPPINMETLRSNLEKAYWTIGCLDGISEILPDISIFLYTYVRQEALLSSQIEGTQSSLSDLFLFEIDQPPSVPIDEIEEVSNCVSAINHGVTRLNDGFPLSQRLMREMHGILLSGGRGSTKLPGEFRRSQNWIGGTRPGNAMYVPPPHTYIADLMSDIERFIHSDDHELSPLMKAGLIHVQFETIHPFLDGNGRLGRLLITLYLVHSGLLQHPTLYLSLYFKRHRSNYYELLQRVRTHGDWETWLDFFLDGIIETSGHGVQLAKNILQLFDEDTQKINQSGRLAASALQVFSILQKRLIISAPYISQATGSSLPTVYKSIHHLEKIGIVKEITGKKRNRLFAYQRYLQLLTESIESS